MIERTVLELAALCGATLEGDGSRLVIGPASLEEARPDQISFLANPRYRSQLAETLAGAVLLGIDVECPRPDLTLLRCEDPNRAFTDVVRAFAADAPRPAAGAHPLAAIDPTARIGEGVHVGPHAVVGAEAVLGRGVIVHGTAAVGAGVQVGDETELHPGAVLYPGVRVGCRCLLHAGAVVGADGFGFEPGPGGWTKIPQCGTVELGDDVEIGAGTTCLLYTSPSPRDS